MTGRQSQSGQGSGSAPGGSENSNGQLAMTRAALEAWGKKIIAWGKKHPGKTYVETYDSDASYTKWILSRMSTLSEEMVDYANYALTRRHLEEAALRHVSP